MSSKSNKSKRPTIRVSVDISRSAYTGPYAEACERLNKKNINVKPNILLQTIAQVKDTDTLYHEYLAAIRKLAEEAAEEADNE